jgi:hypothetical protein
MKRKRSRERVEEVRKLWQACDFYILLTTVIQYFIWSKKFHLLSFPSHLRLYSPHFLGFFQALLKIFENLQ